MDWYVVPAPAMETILALAWAMTVVLVLISANTIQTQPTVTTRARDA